VTEVTYSSLINRYGEHMAYDMLITFEKTAKIKQEHLYLDEESRLQRALAALDNQTIAA